MQQNNRPEENRKKPTHKWIRQCVAGLLAGVMALGTTFSLAPNAFAQESEQEETSAYTCGLEEHTHTEECYEKVTTTQRQVLSCTLASQPDPAAESPSVTILHKHDASCYGADNVLLCPLTEREAHTHGDGCYSAPTLHTHGPACYERVETPVCGKEVTQGHAHSEECNGSTLTCDIHVCTEECGEDCDLKPEEPHEHSEACYQEKTCELEESEGHAHTEACYQQLTCTLTEGQPEGQPQLICEKEEWIPHTHTEECQGETPCEKPEAVEHVHTDACFTTVEEAAEDQNTLTCGKEESEEHQHTALCYGTWELKCELEEHTHEDCEEVEEEEVAIEYGEQPVGTAWLTPAGGISASYPVKNVEEEEEPELSAGVFSMPKRIRTATSPAENTAQIKKSGGSNSAEGGNVNISKQISGTDIENVFDITLTVSTQEDIQEIIADPDMAVVLVMDMSATMMSDFDGGNGENTKYGVALSAAKAFVSTFASNTTGTSRIGFVPFNTTAQPGCQMQAVTNESSAAAFNRQMKTAINSIVTEYDRSRDDKGNITSNTRYTNIQEGLQTAQTMLNSVNNKNKFIIFLSDGLPTTYASYPPISTVGTPGSDGVFYDNINKGYCAYGTNYSDKGATSASGVANTLKNSGVKIYSVGVGLNTFGNSGNLNGVQYIDEQLKRGKDGNVYTIDTSGKTRRGELAVIQAGSFKNWLQTYIGSNSYVDGTATNLEDEYQKIFSDLKDVSITNSANLWTVTDPVPETMEFIAFKNSSGQLENSLAGSLAAGAEDTASIGNSVITWDLKKSGYSKNGNVYTYSVPYRVRLKNEISAFNEETDYVTNGETYLTYNMVLKGTDGSLETSDRKTLIVEVPEVEGYLANLTFTKQDDSGNPLSGAEFTLSHSATCNVCRGDNTTSVSITAQTATSDTNGNVSFTNIPSGHIYTLKETTVPNGYTGEPTEYTVTVAYDNVTIQNITDLDNFTVTNTELTAKTKITGEKTLVNHNQGKHEYTFKLEEVDEQGNPVTNGTIATTTVTFDSKTENTLSFDFGDMTFKGSDLGTASSKTYYYKISENAATSDSLKADDNYYIVEVDVALNENKTELTATQTITKYNSENKSSSTVDKITFTNTLLGELRITKNVELRGSNPMPDHEFAIRVSKGNNPLNPGTQYTVGNKTQNVEQNGVIHLTAGETAVFEELPVGETYTVEEIADSAYGFTVYYAPDQSVTITEKTDNSPYVSIDVTNTEQTATLTLEGTKVIANPDGSEHEYAFQLQQVDGDGNAIGDPVTQTVKTDQSGKFQFPITYTGTMLMGEQSKEFYYQITETTSSDLTVQTDPAVYHMTVKLESINGKLNATPSYTKVVNSVVTPETAVTFTNTLLGSLTLNKQIIGEYPKGETFTFTISGLPNGIYTAALNGAVNPITVQNNTYTVKLTHKDSLVIYGIPHGTPLTITEAKSAYTARYVVNSGWQRNGNSVSVNVSTAGTEVLFKNYSPYGLPQTGQLNWPIPVLAILGIACVGGGIALMRRKKGKHEK